VTTYFSATVLPAFGFQRPKRLPDFHFVFKS